MKNTLTGILWVLVYLLLALAPLLIVATAHPPAGRPFVIELSVALGFVGLAMMGLQFALIARFKPVAAPFGIDALTKFHKQVSFVALTFILAHPILLFLQNGPKYLPLLNVFTAPWRARFAVAATLLLLALIGLSAGRKRLRLSYETWQWTHGILAVAIVLLALAHIQGVGYYTSGVAKRALFYVLAGVLVLMLLWIRILRPLIRLRHPWRIAAIVPERGDTTTMVIEPVNHTGFSFQPGQFGWIIVDRSPFARVHHPFSFSSCGDVGPGGQLALTIKASGDFTRQVASFPVGTKVYLDGPHGVFTMDAHQAQGYVFIGGGVGITPLHSMLLTMQAREDVRPVTLFYANRRWEDVTFREQLQELQASMPNLRIVHVLDEPPDGWTGERGRIDADIIKRHVPARQYQRLEYFICGAPAMLDAMGTCCCPSASQQAGSTPSASTSSRRPSDVATGMGPASGTGDRVAAPRRLRHLRGGTLTAAPPDTGLHPLGHARGRASIRPVLKRGRSQGISATPPRVPVTAAANQPAAAGAAATKAPCGGGRPAADAGAGRATAAARAA